MSANPLEATPVTKTTEAAPVSLLDEVLAATRQTEQSPKGTVTYPRTLTLTLKAGIQALDAALSRQLAAVLHHPTFQKLEGTWRGLHYLVMNSETSAQLKIRMLNVSKRELFKDVD